MSWRPHGHAKVNARSPQAWAVCDRCGLVYNRVDLQWQMEWAGVKLINLQLLVCRKCLDKPQEQLRSQILPADPPPVLNPRPENFAAENLGRPSAQTSTNWDSGGFWDGGPMQIWDE
jgi:hypothetical protein